MKFNVYGTSFFMCWTLTAAALIVMPRSRSKSIESSIWALASRSKARVACSNRSAKCSCRDQCGRRWKSCNRHSPPILGSPTGSASASPPESGSEQGNQAHDFQTAHGHQMTMPI